MKRSRVLAVLVGGVFCVAVMSLYRMLELMQGAELQQGGARPAAQVDEELSRLQQKIDRLERLLSDNNRLVATLRDTLFNHKASWETGGGGGNMSSGSTHSQADTLPGCRLAGETKDGSDGVQLSDVYDLLPFDNPPGGAWKQGFEIHYHGNEWDEQPLELFLVPHSHNDPGWLKTFDRYYDDQTRHILDNMLVKLSEDSSYDVPHTCGPNPSVCCQFDFHRLPGGRVFCPWRIPPQPITEQNIQERALLLLDQYRQKSRLFRSPVLLVPLGDDFRFVESSEWDAQFYNYQKLFDYFEQHPELHVKARFGTLSDYFHALERRLSAAGTTLPTLRGDFFTYADRDDHYWSGYFTSRPFYKRLDRTLEASLRASEILFSLTLAAMRSFRGDGRPVAGFPTREHFGRLTAGRRSLALFQHHDAVTGTARDPVVVDYGNRTASSKATVTAVLRACLICDNESEVDDVMFPQDEVISAPDVLPQKTPLTLSKEPRSLIVFNPTEQQRTSVISVLVDSADARVVDAETGRPMAAQMSAVWAEPSSASTEVFQLDFVAELPPLSLVVYHVTRALTGSAHRARYTFHRHGNPPTVQSQHFQKLRLRSGLVRQVQVQFLWYGTRTGANRDKSGAYLFLPGEEGAQLYSSSEPPLVRVSRGLVFSDITSYFRHFTHTVRLLHLDGHAGRTLEISNTVDIRSEFNRELVMRLVSDVANGNSFFTDLNGFQMQQRRTLEKLPLQANFFPMSSSSFLQDAASRLTLLSAQSQAVAALRPGELELVLDRRLQQDDNRGLGQGVTDNKLTDNLYHLLLEDRRGDAQEVGRASVEHLSLLAHLTSLSLCHPPLTMFAPVDNQLPKIHPFRPLRSSLPCDVHLLNLRTLEDDHVNLDQLFSPLQFRSVRPSGLTLLRDDDHQESAQQHPPTHMVRLQPMEISAYRVTLD
ncbi:hypothetical protein F2P81_016369 [Scophthalmus maximus]|uniref:Alpha-mannosidase n=1 Tax=Scophthalmus maximus TaxID=52904 RepID=A0A6A4SLB8_SCOMX|nr:hypothetical protein F2P81_016369 [Scophthalmus maximus]